MNSPCPAPFPCPDVLRSSPYVGSTSSRRPANPAFPHCRASPPASPTTSTSGR
jgi:hypothetical protein